MIIMITMRILIVITIMMIIMIIINVFFKILTFSGFSMCFSGISDYPECFKCPAFLNVNVFPDIYKVFREFPTTTNVSNVQLF